MTAMMLSVIPGLGQLYNGETRKGFLFLIVGAMNLIILIGMLFDEPILKAMRAFADGFHMKPNVMLTRTMLEAHFGSMVSIILILFFISFVIYACRDAYDHAALKRRKIYPDMVIEMPEATSGSYIFHFAFMAALFILAFFFLIPLPPRAQITDIEFIEPQEKVNHPVKSVRKSTQNSEDRGKHDPKKAVTAHSPAPKTPAPPAPKAAPTPAKAPAPTPSPKPSPQPTPKPSPAPTPKPSPAPTPAPSPRPSPTPTPHPSPAPTPRPMAAPSPAPMTHAAPSPMPMARPTPMAMPSAAPTPMARAAGAPSPMPSLSPSPMARAAGPGSAPSPTPFAKPAGFAGLPSAAPSPIANMHGSGGAPGFGALPKIASAIGGGGAFAPAPVGIAGGGGGGGASGAPAPVPVAAAGGGRGRGGGGGGGASGAPAPVRASNYGGGGGGGGGGPNIVVTPSVPRGGGGGGGGGNNSAGNPGANNRAGNSTGAQADVDFGPYMADLQRRIKKHWFPPKGNESKRVVVIFKIHSGGELSGLRLDHSSGVAIADNAALKAVDDAAPFRPLPTGAPDSVDIQFTFDYNVFTGHGTSTFRQF